MLYYLLLKFNSTKIFAQIIALRVTSNVISSKLGSAITNSEQG